MKKSKFLFSMLSLPLTITSGIITSISCGKNNSKAENYIKFSTSGDVDITIVCDDDAKETLYFEQYDENKKSWEKIKIDQKISLLANNSIKIRGKNPNGLSNKESKSQTRFIFSSNSSDCHVKLSGNIMSLIDYEELPLSIPVEQCFDGLFMENNVITKVSNNFLPAVELKHDCYRDLFSGCHSLTVIPKLPATTLGQYCYFRMFKNCTSLTTAPELPANEIKRHCYQSMFEGCTALTSAPKLPATTLEKCDHCYQSMFQGCTALTSAPKLPATTLDEGCYFSMFEGCTALTSAPELPATTLDEGCYFSMFEGCTALTSATKLPATALVDQCYYHMFYNCKSLHIGVVEEEGVKKIFTCPSTIGSKKPVTLMFFGTISSSMTPVTGKSYYWIIKN